MNERFIQLAERKRVAQHAMSGASPIKVKRDGDIAVSPRRFIIEAGIGIFDAEDLCRKKLDKRGARIKISKVPKKVVS